MKLCGKYLRSVRKVMKWSRARLAKETSTPADTIKNYENGRRPMPGVFKVAVEMLMDKYQGKRKQPKSDPLDSL